MNARGSTNDELVSDIVSCLRDSGSTDKDIKVLEEVALMSPRRIRHELRLGLVACRRNAKIDGFRFFVPAELKLLLRRLSA